jgi:CheY-like chemotaxis protein
MRRQLQHFASMCVLVVDDNPVNVDLLTAMLKTEGLTNVVCETESRRVASILPLVNPDLIVLDLHMPHVDGYQVLDAIAKFAATSYLPVLVVTADVNADAHARALSHGAHAVLTKPLDLSETTLVIARLLEGRTPTTDPLITL